MTADSVRGKDFALGLCLIFSMIVVNTLISRFVFSDPGPMGSLLVYSAMGFAVGGGCFLWLKLGRGFFQFVVILLALYFVLTLLNIFFKFAAINAYGDFGHLNFNIGYAAPNPSWLAGDSLLGWIYSALWLFPPVADSLPSTVSGTGGFISLAGWFAMFASTFYGLVRFRNRLAVVLPMLSVHWLLFSSGYNEYYPFLSGPLVLILAWLFECDLRNRKPMEIGIVAAALSLLYLGFVPMSIMVLLCYGIASWKKAAPALLWAAGIFLVFVGIFWIGGVSDYFRSLWDSANFGAKSAYFSRYRDLFSNPHSFYFTPDYLVSKEHMIDLLYLFFYSGGLSVIGLFVSGLFLAVNSSRKSLVWRKLLLDPRLWLACLIIASQIRHFVSMIPFWGPHRDIDLFFTVFIILLFFSGFLFDLHFNVHKEMRRRALFFVFCFILGNLVVSSDLLMLRGIPREPLDAFVATKDKGLRNTYCYEFFGKTSTTTPSRAIFRDIGASGPYFDDMSELCVEALVKPVNIGQRYILNVGVLSGSPNIQFSLNIEPSGLLNAKIYTGGKVYVSSAKRRVKQGRWHHVALVWSDGQLSAFVDGYGGDKTRTQGRLKNIGSAAKLWVGCLHPWLRPWEGKIDAVCISNVARAPVDFVLRRWPRPLDNVVLLWEISEGKGNTVRDHSGNAYHGSITSEGRGRWAKIWGYTISPKEHS